MQIELQTILTVVSVSAAVIFGYSSYIRSINKDAERKSAETAMISNKLDDIGSDVSEIKRDITSVKKEVSQLSERVITVEQSTKSAHHRIDSFEDDEYRIKRRRRRRW